MRQVNHQVAVDGCSAPITVTWHIPDDEDEPPVELVPLRRGVRNLDEFRGDDVGPWLSSGCRWIRGRIDRWEDGDGEAGRALTG